MAAVDEQREEHFQTISTFTKFINRLGENDRLGKKRALEDIRKETIKKNPPLTPQDLQAVFTEILKPLLKVFSDPHEKCRELSVCLIRDSLSSIHNIENVLPYIVPVLVGRLGQQEITEPSEEVRLQLVQLFALVIELSGKKNFVFLDDSIKILQKTIVDPFPDVRKESCKCSSKLAKTIPEHFHMQSESLMKPLLTSITHQHSKVRALVIATIGDVIQYGNGKSVDTVVSHFAQRLFDQVPIVRESVIKVSGNWLLDLPDRYSFHHKLIPLLLTGITDDQPKISELADSFWHDVGMKYEKENEEELKDKIDFEKPAQEHYPTGVERPNLGCRTLIFRNFSKILPGLVRDIGDWVEETRVKSACLLYTLLLNAEDFITQHMELLLKGLIKASCDEQQTVVQYVQKSAELIGYFVQPEVWCKLILHHVKQSQSFGSLMVLAAVIRGSEKSILKPYIKSVFNVITSPDICHTSEMNILQQLLNCCEATINIMEEDTAEVSQDVFNLLINCTAQLPDNLHRDKVNQLMTNLSSALKVGSNHELYKMHTKPLLDSFEDSYVMWANHSTERLVFDTLVIEAGDVIGEHLDDIMPIFVANLNPEKDPEVRLKFFSLLSRLVMNSAQSLDSHGHFQSFVITVLTKMILPNCVWRAGKTAGAIRTTAVSCLWALLSSGALAKDKLEIVAEDVLTQMITLMEDDNKSTRLISCRVLTRIFDSLGPTLKQDRLHNMYPELLKRLDDSSDEIRIIVTKTFLAYFDCFEEGYDVGLYRAHLEAIIRGLLVHLDDPDEKIQTALLDVLKRVAQIKPDMMCKEVESVKHKHRSTKYCDELLKHSQSLS